MEWPSLVPAAVCRVPIKLVLTKGCTDDSAPAVFRTLHTFCNFSAKGGWTVDEKRQKVRYAAAAFFTGDIAPDLEHLAGQAEVLGLRLAICGAERARNPDGSVNFTRLELF